MSSFLAPRSSRNQKRKAWYKSVKSAEMSWCLNWWCLPRWIPRRPQQTSSSLGTLQPEEENCFAKRFLYIPLIVDFIYSFNCRFYNDKAQLPLSFSQFAGGLPRSFLRAAWSPVWEENAVIIYVTVVINHVVIMKPVGDKSPDKEDEKSGQEFQAKVDVEHWAGKDKCHDYELRIKSLIRFIVT